MYDCKLIASQTLKPANQYRDIIKNGVVEYRMNDTQQSTIHTLDTTSLLRDTKTSIKVTAPNGGCSLMLIGLRERNNLLTFVSFLTINNVAIRRKERTNVKNQAFNTDILKNLDIFELETGEFSLKKEIVVYDFDAAIDRIIVTSWHGAVEVMEDEFYIDFEVPDQTILNVGKSCEVVHMMYQLKGLRVNASTKDVEIKM